jgi:endonuclease/exonuclease/phosphatase family metal-dependent hydrolase
MEAVYLPTVERTTGIAMLSALPVEGRAGALLASEAEQTGLLRLDVRLGGEPVAVYGVWLGLTPEERARQLADALQRMAPGRAAFAGDLNATPDSPVYTTLLAAGFSDPFAAPGFTPLPTDPAVAPAERIDYIWLRGRAPVSAEVPDSMASDHRMVAVFARLDSVGRW